MTQTSEERQEISKEELDKYTESKYRVVTVIPYVEKPVIITRILNQMALDELLDGYEDYGEFLVDISILEDEK